jgi:hypothetical protein
LPSIPGQKSAQHSSKIQKRRPSSTTDRLKLTCHHGPTSSDIHEVQTTLKLIPNGTSPIDRYAQDEQTHERIALGLENEAEGEQEEEEEDIFMLRWRRATDSKTNVGRSERSVRVFVETKRPRNNKCVRNDELASYGGSSGKRKREPQRSDDEQESPERKKTPPSPPDKT